MPTALRALAALAVPMLLVAGCTEDDGTEASDPSSSSAGTDVDYPDEGVDLVGAPVLEGVYRRGLQTYVDFERGRRLAAREGSVGRLLTLNAVADVVDPYRRALRGYDGAYDGDVVIEFVGARPHGDVLHLDLCIDATALAVPSGAPAVLGEATRSPQQVAVTNIEGLWRVTKAESGAGSC